MIDFDQSVASTSKFVANACTVLGLSTPIFMFTDIAQSITNSVKSSLFTFPFIIGIASTIPKGRVNLLVSVKIYNM